MTKGFINTQSGTGAPLRKQPMVEAEMVGAIPSGSEVDLLGYGDGWYLVDAGGVQGYVAGSMVNALDGIGSLGRLKIKKAKKNGKPTATVTATKQVVKDVVDTQKKSGGWLNKAKSAVANKVSNSATKTNSTAKSGGILSKVVSATKDKVKAPVGGNAKENVKAAIKNAKNALEQAERAASSLNGLDGKLIDKIKNVGSKIVNAGKKIVGAGQKAEQVKKVITQPATTTTTTQAATPAVQAETINPVNITTMEESKGMNPTLKKGLIIGGVVAGLATVTVVAVKMSKKKSADKKGLNGVSTKRRKKSRKSKKTKKNTGNKMLNLK